MGAQISRNLKRVALCLADCLFMCVAYAASFLLITSFGYSTGRAIGEYLPIYLDSLPLQVLGVLLFFIPFGLYRDLLRYVSVLEFLRIVVAALCASLYVYVMIKFTRGVWLSASIPITAFYLFLTLVGAVRFMPLLFNSARKYYIWRLRDQDKRTPTLIVGAGAAASAFLKDLQAQGKKSRYLVVGMVDDNPGKQDHSIRGVRILGGSADIPKLVNRHGIQEIIIAIPSATPEQMRNLISICSPTGCTVHTMKAVTEIGSAKVTSLQNLDVSDLLGRREVLLNPKVMATYITGKAILVTGGGGSIGSELCRQILRFDPSHLIVFDFYENNAYDLLQELRVIYPDRAGHVHLRIGSVQDKARLDEVFSEFGPSVVFHAAAYKHVPLMEECPELAVSNNVFGTYNTAECALRHNVRRFVMVSTDKAVNPTNVMGATKRLSEMIIQSMNGGGTEFVAVRFGNVLGSNGSVVPIFRRQIESGGPVTVTHREIIRYFMTIPEAASLVLLAGSMAKGGETFLLDMGDPVKINDLARAMIEMAGLVPDVDIPIQYTALRPGEKLYEELLLGGEGVEKTEDEKIFVVHGDRPTAEDRARILQKLRDTVAGGGDVKACLRELLPDYHPEAHTNTNNRATASV